MLTYDTIRGLVEQAARENKKISEICLQDQAQQLEREPEDLFRQMDESFQVMVDSVQSGKKEGLHSTSGLTGGEGKKMADYADRGGSVMGDFMARATARALSVSNCNAAMGKIVATPTAGSCGILPGCLVSLYEDRKIDRRDIVMSIFTAGAFGIVIAQHASIAGAQGGCQAECGSASGMAAAAVVEAMGGTPQMCANALGMAIVNQMGLVCDPVAGLVEIPCVKRNASGTAIALCSADMALAGIDLKIPVDECIGSMKAVGDSMSPSLKETAGGGLAATETGRLLREKVFGKQ